MDKTLLRRAMNYLTEYSVRRRWRNVVTVLALFVVLSTAYALSTPAITAQSTLHCGCTEHAAHEEACYDAQGQLICALPLHTHSLQCYADPEADVETPEIWERSVYCAAFTDTARDDLVSVAKTQLGYTESERNYFTEENGTVRGYTRYGAWSGTPYAKWDALFCAFCLDYAGIAEDTLPRFADSRAWLDSFAERGLLREKSYTPQAGDLLFLDVNGVTYMGIVTDADGDIRAVLGDWGDAVALDVLKPDDGRILGYGVLAEPQETLVLLSTAEPTATSGTRISSASDFTKLANGGTYYLNADITVSSTVTISSGKTTTLDLNGHKLTSKANPLFIVDGGTLTVDNRVSSESVTRQSASGTEFGKLASYSGGKLTYYITQTEIINASTGATRETQVGYTVGAGMIVGGSTGKRCFEVKRGTLNLDGGYICNFTEVESGAVALVYSGGGATVNLRDAVLAANTAQNGGAIYMDAYCTLNILGSEKDGKGAITGNTATAEGGGGVYAASWSQKAIINMSGGYITNNYTTNPDYWTGGGGIELQRLAQLNMSGGYITSNKAMGGGGGIRTQEDWSNDFSGRVEMSGGFITANNSVNAEGGGLNINAGGSMTMSAGYVTNNVAGGGVMDEKFKDWGGGGMFCSENSCAVVIMNSLVTENKAGGYGGGVAGCSTGRIVSSPAAGTGIFENEALGVHLSGDESTKNEDHFYAGQSDVFKSHGYQDYFCALSSTISGSMLGGGAALWEGSSDGVPVSTISPTDTITGASVTGLTCCATEADRANARAAATSFFNGNESPTHGGGILVNGYLILGDVDTVGVYARIELQGLRKKLLDETGAVLTQKEDSYTFVVRDDRGEELARAGNAADGSITLDRRLSFTSSGTFRYTIHEVLPSDPSGVLYDTALYEMVVVVTEDNNVGPVPWTDLGQEPFRKIGRVQYKLASIVVTELNSGEVIYENYAPENNEAHSIGIKPLGDRSFTNYVVNEPEEETPTEERPDMSVSVTKKWADGKTRHDPVSVSLLDNGTVLDTQMLNDRNRWSYTWNGLELSADYTVQEIPVAGYAAEYSFSYEYDTTSHEDRSSTNAARLFVLSGSSFIPASTLSEDHEYAIASPDGTRLLCISAGHEDAALSSADASKVTPQADGTYLAADVPDLCRFTYHPLNRDGYNYHYLKNKPKNSFLLVQWADGTCLKATNSNWYSSPISVRDGKLMGQYEWTSGGEWRYIIWDGEKFNTDTQISFNTYETVDAVHKSYTVTNTPTEDISYSVTVTKIEEVGETKQVVPGAEFELRDGDTPLHFTEESDGSYVYDEHGTVTTLKTNTAGRFRIRGLPSGSYELVETETPEGYTTSTPQTVTLTPETPEHSVDLVLEGAAIEYALPETGGIGARSLALMGFAVTVTALMGLLLPQRRKKLPR